MHDVPRLISCILCAHDVTSCDCGPSRFVANDSIDIFATRTTRKSAEGRNIITVVTKYPPGVVARKGIAGALGEDEGCQRVREVVTTNAKRTRSIGGRAERPGDFRRCL